MPGKPVVPELDLAFAISASASNADETFNKMKEVINSIIDKYGSGRIHYGFVVFGTNAFSKVNFGDIYPSDEQLKNTVSSVPRPTGSPSLDKLLTKAKDLFDAHNNHPKAKKVLVVIVDDKSTTSSNVIKSKAKDVIDRGVRVIPVAIGNDADPTQLEETTDDEGNVIKDKDIDDPEELGKKIMDKILKGRKKQLFIAKFLNSLYHNSVQ